VDSVESKPKRETFRFDRFEMTPRLPFNVVGEQCIVGYSIMLLGTLGIELFETNEVERPVRVFLKATYSTQTIKQIILLKFRSE